MNPDCGVKGVIIENTFSSIADMVDVMMPIVSIFKYSMQRIFFPSVERIKFIEQPILFIRGLKDEIVPADQSKALEKAAVRAKFK